MTALPNGQVHYQPNWILKPPHGIVALYEGQLNFFVDGKKYASMKKVQFLSDGREYYTGETVERRADLADGIGFYLTGKSEPSV